MRKFLEWFLNFKVVLSLYILLAVSASLQSYFSGNKIIVTGEKIEYTKFNNYIIFKNSFSHLIENKDLYKPYSEEHWDLYKYTPTFALFFGFFHLFPDWFGLIVWNLLNALVLFFAIWFLPRLSERQKLIALLICTVELLTSLQNEQSNGLTAGLIILGFGFIERKQYWFSTLMMMLSVYIKLFGIVGFIIYIFYPNKWKTILASATWALILFALPLIVSVWDQYVFQLQSFITMLSSDHSMSYGLSVMGWLNSWFGLELNKIYTLLTGTVILLLPLFRVRMVESFSFRIFYLSSILIWLVIFNHKAESPTFIIAMAGIAIWHVSRITPLVFEQILIALAIIFTSLSPADIFPPYIRNNYFVPLMIKVVVPLIVWIVINFELWLLNRNASQELFRR